MRNFKIGISRQENIKIILKCILTLSQDNWKSRSIPEFSIDLYRYFKKSSEITT